MLSPDLLGFGGRALRERGVELGDESVGLLCRRRRQGGEEGVDLCRERFGTMRAFVLCPGQ
ncbi:MAG TPA: hypothetical protein VGO80_01980 [Solirubrobacteraceae bacterium]|nr:hypothetical protein [Solirubrobacteraceae bacterium]